MSLIKKSRIVALLHDDWSCQFEIKLFIWKIFRRLYKKNAYSKLHFMVYGVWMNYVCSRFRNRIARSSICNSCYFVSNGRTVPCQCPVCCVLSFSRSAICWLWEFRLVPDGCLPFDQNYAWKDIHDESRVLWIGTTASSPKIRFNISCMLRMLYASPSFSVCAPYPCM